MRKVVIFIKYFVFCLVIGVPANIYGIYVKEFISNINGLTNNSVNCILEDSENVIWVGTWYNPQIQISAESETKRSIFRKRDKTKRSKKESAQHSKSRNKSFVMTSVSAL